jgi:hypothetical protein
MDLAVRAGKESTEPRLATIELGAAGLNAGLPHDSLDSATTNGFVLSLEHGVDPWAATEDGL